MEKPVRKDRLTLLGEVLLVVVVVVVSLPFKQKSQHQDALNWGWRASLTLD